MLQPPQNLPPEIIEQIASNRELRLSIAQTYAGFALAYFPHYFSLPAAEFHPDLMSKLQDGTIEFLAVTGFRGSSKSTHAGTIYVLYEALIKKTPFIIPINDTDDVVKLTIANIREELEHNQVLIQDFGNMIQDKGKTSKFTETNILLANGVRIMGRSRGQKIRGLRHMQHRPRLVVIDDPEELKKVQKKDYRDKTEAWIRDDIIPAIEETKARLIIIGNMLHTDSLMARLKNNPVFTYVEYPLIKGEEKWENCTWKGKYPSPEALKRQEAKVGRTAWLREYLLKVVPPEGQEVKDDWIQYYDRLPEITAGKAGVGVDLAISKNEAADFTAMTSGVLSIDQTGPKIYVLPSPVNARLSFQETIWQMKSIHMALRLYAHPTFYIEKVAYQQAAIEEAQRHMLVVRPMRPGADKRARLRTAATYIQNGTVLFPRKGAEDLINQLLNFGIEDHDDLVDSLVYLILGLADEGLSMPEVIEII